MGKKLYDAEDTHVLVPQKKTILYLQRLSVLSVETQRNREIVTIAEIRRVLTPKESTKTQINDENPEILDLTSHETEH